MEEYLIHKYTLTRYNTHALTFSPTLKLNKSLVKSNVSELPKFVNGMMIIPFKDGTIRIYQEGTQKIIGEHKVQTDVKRLPPNPPLIRFDR